MHRGELSGKRVFLHFEAVNQVADVFLNGSHLGKHIGGYTGFDFDITDYVFPEGKENIIGIKVDNSYNYNIPPHAADYDMYGGIYRNVYIEITPNVYVDHVILTSPVVSVDLAKLQAKTEIINKSGKALEIRLVTNVVNQDQEIVATAESSKILQDNHRGFFLQKTQGIPFPHLWSPGSPYLYRIFSTLFVDGKAVDEIETPFGFRWYRFDANKGFYLNGKHLKLRGVNKHQDYFAKGFAVPDSLQVRDIKIIKNMGATFIRLAHYPQAQIGRAHV